MKLKRIKYLIYFLAAFIVSGVTLTSCLSEDEPDPWTDPDYLSNNPLDRVILVYAVASNNLSRFLTFDKEEMLEGARGLDIEKCRMLVYSVNNTDSLPKLEEIIRGEDGSPKFHTIKEYDRNTFSTDPARICKVIDDVITLRPAKTRGLMLWSHGGNWAPVPRKGKGNVIRDIEINDENIGRNPNKWFGQDINNAQMKFGDIINVTDAIPADTFDFIWFDSCYMGGIEVAYQLRGKCEYFIAYPSEVWDEGCPYNLVLPFILKEQPSYVGAADAFFNFYKNHNSIDKRNATIGVFDMVFIEDVAKAAEAIYHSGKIPLVTDLQVYTRSNLPIPGYDFGQYTKGWITDEETGGMLLAGFNQAMERFTIFKAITDFDFNHRPFKSDVYSGLSCHYFEGGDNADNEYYRNLDWYKRVYE